MSALIITSRVGDYHRSTSHRPHSHRSHSGRVAQARRPAAEQPNYAARRIGALFVALSAVFLAVSLVGSVMAGFAGSPASAAGAEASPSVAVDAAVERAADTRATHVAVAGDSLWSIADEYRGSVDRDRYVDALERLNGGTVIVVGQAIILP